jgi:hypothetical protein
LVAATALLLLAGLAALAMLVFGDWHFTGSCFGPNSDPNGPPCTLTPDSAPASWFGGDAVILTALASFLWCSAYAFWLYAHRLHHRPGPRGLPTMARSDLRRINGRR